MKRTIALSAMLLALVLALTACGCDHQWTDADCTTPRTCTQCQETEGNALGHSWAEAACTAPKTCQTCKVTEGEALGHDWQEATTEAPKTCSRCALTEGERIITDPRFTTAACKALFGLWEGELTQTGEEMGMDGYLDSLTAGISLEFGNAGELTARTWFEEAEVAKLTAAMIQMMYDLFAQMDMDKATADAAVQATYGKTMDEYVAEIVAEIGTQTEETEVYYVEDNVIWSAETWSVQEMDKVTFTLNGDTLTISEEGAADIVLKRAAG